MYGAEENRNMYKRQIKNNIVLAKLLFIVPGQPMDARPNGQQSHRRTPSSSTDSPRQAASSHPDDRYCSPPQRQAAAISSIASLALDTIFRFPPTERGRGNGIKNLEDLMNMKIEFLGGYDASFREQTPTDILLVPYDGPSLPAHKAILAARSNMLDQPNKRKARLCEALPCESETMEIGFSHEVLEALLIFLYTGSLPWEKMEKQIDKLFSLACYYEILYLWEFCAHHILSSLTPSNALQVFELAFGCRHRGLLEAALHCIFENMEEIVFSSEYQEFALGFRCREMCMNITRAFCMYAKFRGVTGV